MLVSYMLCMHVYTLGQGNTFYSGFRMLEKAYAYSMPQLSHGFMNGKSLGTVQSWSCLVAMSQCLYSRWGLTLLILVKLNRHEFQSTAQRKIFPETITSCTVLFLPFWYLFHQSRNSSDNYSMVRWMGEASRPQAPRWYLGPAVWQGWCGSG